ncbi:hypothetical protein HQ590_16170, partial [bacterium]|nr:hypothetical protein [bacterium]
EGKYVIGFGPRRAPGMAVVTAACDAFFDTGTGADDRMVKLPDGTRAGRTVHLANALNGWVFIAELVGALTRQGKMPAMYLSYACVDGKEWGARYLWEKQFHDDYTIAPIPAGELGRAYVTAIRGYITAFRKTQLSTVDQAVELLGAAAQDGQKVLVLPTGHMPYTYIGKFEDARWVNMVDFEYLGHKDAVLAANAVGQLALRLGYFGEPPELTEVLRSQKFRLVYVSSGNPRPGYQIAKERLLNIDTGMPFGDACVSIKDYPIKIFAPSGIMQIVAYEAINTEVLTRLAKKK